MLERDYTLEMIGQFSAALVAAFRRALAGDEDGLADAEREIADLIELEPELALSLALLEGLLA